MWKRFLSWPLLVAFVLIICDGVPVALAQPAAATISNAPRMSAAAPPLHGSSDADARSTSALQAAQRRASAPQPPASPTERAEVQAAKTGKPVEVTELGTAKSQVFADPDGKLTLKSSMQPYRWQDGSKQWHDLDVKLAHRSDGSFGERSGPAEGARFAKTASNTLGSVGSPAASGVFTWGPEGAAPVAGSSAAGNTATYRGALSGGRDMWIDKNLKHEPVGDENKRGYINPFHSFIPGFLGFLRGPIVLLFGVHKDGSIDY